MNDSDLAALLPPVSDHANKYTRGSLLVLAGSSRFPGAALLAARAAARTGAGYVTLACPAPAAQIAQCHLLSVPVIAAPSEEGGFSANAWEYIKGQLNHIDAVVLGPGITISPAISAFVQSVCRNVRAPLLMDADALNILAAVCGKEGTPPPCLASRPPSGSPSRLPSAPLWQNLILTPHGGELKRLSDATQTDSPEALAQALDCVVIAKGPTTQVASPTQNTRLSAGSAALARAGTGDVLSGVIGSLLAQGVPAYDAGLGGVEIHGRAGLLAEQRLGRRSVCAEDVIEALPTVIQQLDMLM